MPRKSTRNAQGGGTIRQRPDGRWEARYTVGRDSGSGKQVQRSVYALYMVLRAMTEGRRYWISATMQQR